MSYALFISLFFCFNTCSAILPIILLSRGQEGSIRLCKKFCKVSALVSFLNEVTRELTFENFHQYKNFVETSKHGVETN